MKVELLLKGLGCFSCAQKIETNVSKVQNISNVSINFATSTMSLELDKWAPKEEKVNEVREIVKSIEEHVIVIEKNLARADSTKLEFFPKGEIAKLIIGTTLFILALASDFNGLVSLALYSLSYVLIGSKVLEKAIGNIFKGEVFDENFLMTIATLGAFIIKQYPEAVAVMLFYQIGEGFQNYSVNNSKKSIEDLMNIRPDYANLYKNGQETRVNPEEIAIGDIILVKPGEKIPLDGIVVEGNGQFDTSALTGEAFPKDIEVGQEVLSGFINKGGLVKVRITKLFHESTVAKILELVESAANKKAPTERFITKFARYYTPIVVVLAFLIAVVPPLVLVDATFSQWFYRALVFLVISCPCALVVSIPLGFFGGIGGAARKGILVKGGNYLEALNTVDTVIFDKTGTLTKGIFKVKEIRVQENFNHEDVLKYAAIGEVYSNHPISKSILEAYNGEIDKNLITDYREIPGKGVKLLYDTRELLVGNRKLMEEYEIAIEPCLEQGTQVFVAFAKKFAGSILISDQIKEDALTTVEKLKELGVKQIIMLTGDNNQVGQEVGKHLAMDKIYSELLPQNKVEILESFLETKDAKKKIIFVGDGINDAPVLARADIGVAMGGLGSDAAIEAADVVIMNDEPSKLVSAIKIAKKTNRIVWQNIVLALGIKIIFLVLGALGMATMWEAVFADVGVALLAILNAMRVMNTSNL